MHTRGNADAGAKARGPTSVTSTVRKRSGTSRDLPVVLNDTWTGSTVCFWKSTFTLHVVLKKESQYSVTGKRRARGTSPPLRDKNVLGKHPPRRAWSPQLECCFLNGHTPARDTAHSPGLTVSARAACPRGSEVSGLGLPNSAGGQRAGPGRPGGPRPPSGRAPARCRVTHSFAENDTGLPDAPLRRKMKNCSRSCPTLPSPGPLTQSS